MNEAHHNCIDIRDVDQYHSDGSDMIGEDNREINVPSFLIPFLNRLYPTLLYSTSSVFASPFSAVFA